MSRLVDRGRDLWGRWKASRLGRALERYDDRNGSLLCGGMAYAALFSLFAALAIGYTVLVRVLGGNPDLRDAVLAEVDTWLPGLVDTGDGGALAPDELMVSTALSLTSVAAAVVLLFSATGFMGALRTAVRAMFDLGDDEPNAVTTRLIQLAGFVLLGIAVLTGAALSVAVSSLTPRLLDLVGITGSVSEVTVRAVGVAVGLALDALVVTALLHFVGGVRPPTRHLLLGALLVAVVGGGLRYLGTEVIVGGLSRNALLGSFAAVATILVLINLLGRVLLLASAWMAEVMAEDKAGDKAEDTAEDKAEDKAEAAVPGGEPGTAAGGIRTRG